MTRSRARARPRRTGRSDRDESRGTEPGESLVASLEATEQGLSAFLSSLRRSGLLSATNGYRELAAVLVNQRLWARAHGRTDVDPQFRAIGETAREICAALRPYVSIFELMTDLEHLDEPEEAGRTGERPTEAAADADIDEPGDPEPATDATGETPGPGTARGRRDGTDDAAPAARSSGGPHDPRALAVVSAVDDVSVVDEVVRELSAREVLERRGWGRGVSYGLAPAVQQMVLAAMAGPRGDP
jgi:hypothetical protein